MQRRWVALCPKPCAADRPLGNSVGAIGSVVWGHPGLASEASRRLGGRFGFFPACTVTLYSAFARRCPMVRPGCSESYLVDSASSHMLVSKIKPCMSKYKQLYRETANGSLNQLSFI